MQEYEGKIKTKFHWIVPLVIGVSKTAIDKNAFVYALHITTLFEICFNWKGKKSKYVEVVFYNESKLNIPDFIICSECGKPFKKKKIIIKGDVDTCDDCLCPE